MTDDDIHISRHNTTLFAINHVHERQERLAFSPAITKKLYLDLGFTEFDLYRETTI